MQNAQIELVRAVVLLTKLCVMPAGAEKKQPEPRYEARLAWPYSSHHDSTSCPCEHPVRWVEHSLQSCTSLAQGAHRAHLCCRGGRNKARQMQPVRW